MKRSLGLILLFLYSCGGIKLLSVADRASLYSPEFLGVVERVNELHKKSENSNALALLLNLDENNLSDEEQSMRRNLIGQVHLNKNNYKDVSNIIRYFINIYNNLLRFFYRAFS